MTARYETLVHARNRNKEYGVPVTVYAEDFKSAVKRAVDIGWLGLDTDASVTVINVEEVPPNGRESAS